MYIAIGTLMIGLALGALLGSIDSKRRIRKMWDTRATYNDKFIINTKDNLLKK